MIPKISVIVPCYNVAPYLERGIRSLLMQTFSDIEFICIDDASTDRTREMLENFALIDTRIKLIKLDTNIGAAMARNAGIDAAMGEYIGFMDPDDFVDHDFYQKLINKASNTNADVVVGNYREFSPQGQKINQWRTMKAMAESKWGFQYHFTAIYKRDFLNADNIRYPDLRISEDDCFEAMVKLSVSDAKFQLVPNTYYNYLRRIGSLYSWFLTEKAVLDSIKSTDIIIELLNTAVNNKRVTEENYKFILGRRIYYMADNLFFRTSNKDIKQKIAEAILRIYTKLKFRDFMFNNPERQRLAAACESQDLDTVIYAINQGIQKILIKNYLFGFIPFSKIITIGNIRTTYIFGILVHRSIMN